VFRNGATRNFGVLALKNKLLAAIKYTVEGASIERRDFRVVLAII